MSQCPEANYHLPTPSLADDLRIHQNIQKIPKGESDGK